MMDRDNPFEPPPHIVEARFNAMKDDLTKTCTTCGIEKNIKHYHKQKTGFWGVRSKCIECTKKTRKANKERLKKRSEYHEKKARVQALAEAGDDEAAMKLHDELFPATNNGQFE